MGSVHHLTPPAADCLQRPLRSRFRQQLRRSVGPKGKIVEFLEAYKAAVNAAELQEPRRVICRTLSDQLDACGERLWAFGSGGPDFRTALSLVVQFGGSLSTGAVALAERSNWYAASALVRQPIEVEYLVRLFRRIPEQACMWLRASSSDLRNAYRRRRCENALARASSDTRSMQSIARSAVIRIPERISSCRHEFLNDIGMPSDTNESFWIDLAQTSESYLGRHPGHPDGSSKRASGCHPSVHASGNGCDRALGGRRSMCTHAPTVAD